MNNRQVRNFYTDKDIVSPLTDELVSARYRQKSGGYIKYARECHEDNPTQYWHLIHSWSGRKKDDVLFTKRIQCGELIFWMAEVSDAFSMDELTVLKDEIIKNYLHDRKKGNRIIQEFCFDRIVNIVESYDKLDEMKPKRNI